MTEVQLVVGTRFPQTISLLKEEAIKLRDELNRLFPPNEEKTFETYKIVIDNNKKPCQFELGCGDVYITC